jgi:hypothetical protein
MERGSHRLKMQSSAVDEACPDRRHVVALLDAMPGAFGRAQLGVRQAEAGQTVSLDEL